MEISPTATPSRRLSCPPSKPTQSPSPTPLCPISLFHCLSSAYHYLKLSKLFYLPWSLSSISSN